MPEHTQEKHAARGFWMEFYSKLRLIVMLLNGYVIKISV